MGCVYRSRVNHLWSLWYCVLVVLLHAYLVYCGIERYKLYAELSWPPGQYPRLWLTVYGVLHAASVCLVPIFIATAAFKTGNLASDNDRLGDRAERTVATSSTVDCCSQWLKTLWQHAPPVAQCVHLAMAFMLLIAQQLMLAVLYKTAFIRKEDVWSTELDLFVDRKGLLSKSLPANVSAAHRLPKGVLDRALSNHAIAPRLVPLLANQQLFGLPLEFVNYVLALLAVSIVYPAVYWRLSKCFSLIFSIHLLFHLVVAVFGYIAFSLLFRVQLTGATAMIGAMNAPFLLKEHLILLGVYLGSSVVVFAAGVCVYGYGYNKYYTCWAARRGRVAQVNAAGKVENSMTRSIMHGTAASHLCCEGYGPHIAAIGLLIVMVLVKAPIMYDLMVLYQHRNQVAVVFCCIITDVAYLFWWILLWLALTLKRDWSFRVLYSVPELICSLQADRQPGVKHSQQHIYTPNELTNALLLVHGDDAFFTTDDSTKMNIIRQAHKHGVVPHRDDAYWLRGSNHASPRQQHRQAIPMDKQSPESRSLLPDAVTMQEHSDAHSMAVTYQTVERSRSNVGQEEPTYSTREIMLATDSRPPRHQMHPTGSVASSYTGEQHYGATTKRQVGRQGDPVSTFGTLPRGQAARQAMMHEQMQDYMTHRGGTPQQTRKEVMFHDENISYASVHKQALQADQLDYAAAYGGIGQNQYARPGPPKARVLAVQGQRYQDANEPNAANYSYMPKQLDVRGSPGSQRAGYLSMPTAYANTKPPTTTLGTFAATSNSGGSSMRSPSSDQGVASASTSTSSREPTPTQQQQHQRHGSDATLTAHTAVHWVAAGAYQVQPPPAMLMLTVCLQNANGQEVGYTPPGTLTSQGSYSMQYNSQPPVDDRARAQLTVAAANNKHQRNDSANFSLTSSESAGMTSQGTAARQANFATSCV